MRALIALEDDTIFEAESFAGRGEIEGELVFNTSLTGYQEILTDPSYNGQIVTLTYPLIGNYGINYDDMESYRPFASGLVVGECSRIPSNWRADMTLPTYLEDNGILGVHRVDTRAITLHIRHQGAMKCVVSTEDLDRERLVARAKRSPGLVGRDLATEVSVKEPMTWTEGVPADREARFRVAVLDVGMKYNQMRILAGLGCELQVFPATTSADEMLAAAPDGFFISNGPGDPQGVPRVIDLVKRVAHSGTPTFGICFGHQLLGLALGGKTYKLKFGHRGGNQPVLDLATGKVEITSQNHGFCVDKDSLPPEIETTHINLNDQTSEGLRHTRLPVFSVQYHPEAAPGPNDARHLFTQFVRAMEETT